MALIAVFSIVMSLLFLAWTSGVGAVAATVKGGYLYRRDVVQVRRRGVDASDTELYGPQLLNRSAAERKRIARRLVLIGGLGVVTGFVAAFTIDSVAGVAIGVGGILIPGATWIPVAFSDS